MKLVGNLVFNQRDGVIKHRETSEVLAKYPVKIAVPITWIDPRVQIAIDSTGVKYTGGAFKVHKELLDHVDHALYGVYALDPSATDATVDAELYCLTCGTVVEKHSFSGSGGIVEKVISKDILMDHSNHYLHVRLNVTTASATSGANQVFAGAWLTFIYDLTKQ